MVEADQAAQTQQSGIQTTNSQSQWLSMATEKSASEIYKELLTHLKQGK